MILASSALPVALQGQRADGDTGGGVGGAATALASDSWKGVEIFADNTWDVVTFPKTMDRQDWIIFGGIVGVGAGLYAVDGDIQDWFRRNDGNEVKQFIRDTGGGVGGAATALASDSWKGVEIFADNTWDVVTFPKTMDRQDWVIFGGILGVGAGLYAVDGDIQDWFRRNDGNEVKQFIRDTGDFFEPLGDMGETNRYYIAAMAVGYLGGWDKLNWIGQDMLFSHFIASLTRKTVRGFVGRHRPEFGAGPRSFDPFSDEGTSFPSGHASSAFQVAAVLSHHIDNLPLEIALYAMATTVAFQRVDTGGHWASDTWIGSAWGWGVAQIVLNNGDRRRGIGEDGNVRVGIDPATGMMSVSILH